MSEYTYLGNFSAVDPAYSRGMVCTNCRVSWTGCWDNFQCPQCGEGELPSSTVEEAIDSTDPEDEPDEDPEYQREKEDQFCNRDDL